jgi:hypothetical protein
MRKIERDSIAFLCKGKGKFPIFVLVTSLFLVCDARGQSKTGTIIVAGITDKQITVASDSWVFDERTGKKMGNECKVAALSPKFLLAVSGAELMVPPNHPESRWDPYEAGREAMREALLHPEMNLPLARRVASFWTSIALQRIQSIENVARDWFLAPIKIGDFDAAFFGAAHSGRVSAAIAIECLPRSLLLPLAGGSSIRSPLPSKPMRCKGASALPATAGRRQSQSGFRYL